MQAVRVEKKRNMLENQLEHAKSKEEVQKISSSALASVREHDPAKQYMWKKRGEFTQVSCTV